MTSKVEELRFNILVMVKAYEAKICGDNSGAEAEVDSLIAASRAEGVAAGAAAEREKIRSSAIYEGWSCIGDGVRRVCEIPSSLLAPDKEGEK